LKFQRFLYCEFAVGATSILAVRFHLSQIFGSSVPGYVGVAFVFEVPALSLLRILVGATSILARVE
jgi:hypothetical protein